MTGTRRNCQERSTGPAPPADDQRIVEETEASREWRRAPPVSPRKKPTAEWTRVSEGIEYKKLKNRETLYHVRWFEGGDKTAREDEYFSGHTEAKDFRARLIANGRRHPDREPAPTAATAPEILQAAPFTALATAPVAPEPPAAPAGPAFPGRTMAAAFDIYLAYLEERNLVEPRQLTDYRSLWERHVLAAVVTVHDENTDGTTTERKVGPLGGLHITEITASVIDAWVVWMTKRTYIKRKARPERRRADGSVVPKVDEIKKPYSPKTIRDIHGTVISPMLGWIATRNPCAGVQLPPLKFQAVSLDEVPVGAEIPLWMRFGYDVSVLAGDLITLAVCTGLRYSELTALRVRDIDLDAKTLRVAQAIKLDKNHRPYIANYGKTDSALRTIRIGDDLCRLLRHRKANLAPDDLIFQAPPAASSRPTTSTRSTGPRS
ncbi:hypothetical protein LO762_32090 [Actinocorallia sp. API 0066]|uniref:hypothetical protein n=1 Tax=Actinocorallia sp. API 0066 TaxID=2896846 RepID=UPI001E4904EE|nr:hypothetical protein [Actinocorallia sp. API 0066]MCD0453790.1 hypothetical protein [Actinocorallia sp. API 0066]